MNVNGTGAPRGDTLADVLERILDKGLVVAGDIQLNLLDIEVLTIKVRLLLASADTAQQMGIDWWRHDSFYGSAVDGDEDERAQLQERVDRLERMLEGSGEDVAEVPAEAEDRDASRSRETGDDDGDE